VKAAVTDERGQFALKSLDPELLFRLLAVADGHSPAYSAKSVDPKAGPTTLKLKPHDLDARDPALVLKGRVLDEKGDPVAGATVEPYGLGKGDGAQFGGLTGFDPLALTNDSGEFRLGVPERGVAVYVQVSAPSLARRNFLKIPAGPKGHDLTLPVGVTVTGRLLKGGQPLRGVGVGLVQTDRGVEEFVGEYRAGTDGDGRFTIPNVPPDDAFTLYGLMDALKAHGAVAARPAKTGASGTEVEVGDVAVTPGHRLSGRVILADGKPVPEGTRVLLSREEAWDSQQAVADKDGRFEFTGLPAERVNLYATVRGYRVSPKNASYELLNRTGLSGRVTGDINGLRLLLEPGDRPTPSGQFDRQSYEEYKRRREAPLRGAPEEP
jgi:hypothetical protein